MLNHTKLCGLNRFGRVEPPRTHVMVRVPSVVQRFRSVEPP